MASKEIGWKKLELQTANIRLARVYHAGLNPQEFSRATRVQEIETMCISLLCDEFMRYIAEANNAKKKRQPMAFSDLSYIWSGILLVFKAQTKILYDEVMRQAHFTLDYVQKSQTIITLWQKPTKSSKSRSRKNNEPVEHLLKKRVKFADAEFDWQALNDSEVDDESTIQILRTSKVMNRDQISIREVISEPLPDLLSQYNEFEAAESGSTQNFLTIRELVAEGRSIVHAIQGVTPMVAGENEPYDEDGYYAPMTSRQSSPLPHSPLPDIERCYEESDVGSPHRDDSVNVERPGNASSHDISLPSLPSQLLLQKPAKKGKKHRRVFDDVKQILAGIDNPENDKKLMRCANARSDCVTKVVIMRELKMINFNKPAHSFRELKPRAATETASMMVGMQRVKKTKRREPDDLNMVQDFLKSFGCEPHKDVQPDLQLENMLKEDQPLQNHVNRRSIRKRSSSTYVVADRRPQPCNERLPQTSELCDLDFGYEEDDPMDDPEEAVPVVEPSNEPDPIAERSYGTVPEHEPNLPSVKRSPIMDRQENSDPVTNVSRSCNFQLASENLPRSILRLLNQFVTVGTTNETCRSSSQASFLLANQKNRENWGLKGVLRSLFRLWYRNVHPVGMLELLYPQKQKLAAALAFYSIMELNSPRIGLILIEKVKDSNAVYNIAMSEKLVNLLRKTNGH